MKETRQIQPPKAQPATTAMTKITTKSTTMTMWNWKGKWEKHSNGVIQLLDIVFNWHLTVSVFAV